MAADCRTDGSHASAGLGVDPCHTALSVATAGPASAPASTHHFIASSPSACPPKLLPLLLGRPPPSPAARAPKDRHHAPAQPAVAGRPLRIRLHLCSRQATQRVASPPLSCLLRLSTSLSAAGVPAALVVAQLLARRSRLAPPCDDARSLRLHAPAPASYAALLTACLTPHHRPAAPAGCPQFFITADPYKWLWSPLLERQRPMDAMSLSWTLPAVRFELGAVATARSL